jgi:competence protein ComEA
MHKSKKIRGVIIIVLLTALMAITSVQATGAKVDINTATVKELTSLQHVGEVIAKRIIEYREQIEGFKSVEAIKEVKGFGEKAWKANKDRIVITPYKKKGD